MGPRRHPGRGGGVGRLTGLRWVRRDGWDVGGWVTGPQDGVYRSDYAKCRFAGTKLLGVDERVRAGLRLRSGSTGTPAARAAQKGRSEKHGGIVRFHLSPKKSAIDGVSPLAPRVSHFIRPRSSSQCRWSRGPLAKILSVRASIEWNYLTDFNSSMGHTLYTYPESPTASRHLESFPQGLRSMHGRVDDTKTISGSI